MKPVAASLTNRALAEIAGYNLPSVRKWVIAFLPPDPRVGQHAGVPRTHTIDESFRVFLGGKLVSQCGLAIPDAQVALKEILRLLEERKWMPSDHTLGRDNLPFPQELLFTFWKTSRDSFKFATKATMHRRPKFPLEPERNQFIEEFELIEFGARRGLKTGPIYNFGVDVLDFVNEVQEYLVDHDLAPAEMLSNIPGTIRMFHEDEE